MKQLKYAITLLAVLSLAFLEVCYVLLFGQAVAFALIDFVVGSMLVVVLITIAFYFVDQLQTQLQQEIKEREEIEGKLLLRSTALESAANAIAITDENGRFLWVNPAFTKLTGYSLEEAVGQTPSILRSGFHDREFYNGLWQTISSGDVWEGELINRRKNGRLYTEEQIITPVLNEDGKITNYIAIKHDITKRKKSEDKLQQYTERLRLIHSIDQAILSKQTPNEIAQAALDYAAQIIPFSRASVALIDEIKYEGSLLAVIQNGETAVSSGYVFTLSDNEIDSLQAPESAPPIEIIEIDSPRSEIGKHIKNEGIRAHIKIPLIAQSQLVGFFNLGASTHDVFSDEHINIAKEIATSLAIALQQARLYLKERHQREQAEALRETGEALSSSLDFDEILKLLLGQVSRAIRYDSAHIIQIEGNVATIFHTHGYERYGKATVQKVENLSFKVSDTPNLKWIIEHKEPLIISDVHNYEGWRKEKGVSQTRAWVGVPIVVDEEISVLFALSKQQPDYYHKGHVDTLRAFASQVGLALENARLYEELKIYATELETRVAARTQALADANERLKELDRLKTKFISDVSHELRTPITNVTMYIDLLEHGYEDKRQQYMIVLKKETRRLSQLIEEIFDESQYTSHLRQAEYMPVDMNKIAFRVIKNFQRDAIEDGLNLTHDLEPDLPHILGEPLQLAQVVSNILRNAINYTDVGEIKMTTRQDDNSIVLVVADTGSGISSEDLPHLFDRFYRGQNASQSTIPGTGLGLGTVREIIELHGGTVMAGNNDNGGASFQITLPLAQQTEKRYSLEEAHKV